MNRLYILLTVMVVMVLALFPGQGDDKVYAGAGADRIFVGDADGVDHIDCGAGFDVVESIHRADKIKSNCERVLGPRAGGTTTGTRGTITGTTGTTGTTTGTSTTGITGE